MSNNIGKSVHDLKYNYTIDQIYLFFEQCKKQELFEQKMNAITLAQALVYASPSYDQVSVNRKRQMWTRFINSLSWEKINKSRNDGVALIKAFENLGMKKRG